MLTPSVIELLEFLYESPDKRFEGLTKLREELNWSQAKIYNALRNVERLGFVEVEVTSKPAPTHEYHLTDKGVKAWEILRELESLL